MTGVAITQCNRRQCNRRAVWLVLLSALELGCGSFAAAQSSASAPTAAQTQPAGFQHTVRLAPLSTTVSADATRWHSRPLVTLTGTIVRFDAEQIQVLGNDQTVPTGYAADRVVDIAFTQIPGDQREAIAQFQQQNFAAALPALIRCVSDRETDSRPPVWRQQWLSMLAAQAAMRSNRGEIAIELVKQLDARPMPLMVLALLPIDWTGSVGEPLREAAVQAAASDSPAVKLVAASWLLRSREYRASADAALGRLANQRDRPELAGLAEMLRWRAKPPPEIQAGIMDWETEIQSLPMVMRTGPMICLLDVARQVGLQEVARKWELVLKHAVPTWHPDR